MAVVLYPYSRMPWKDSGEGKFSKTAELYVAIWSSNFSGEGLIELTWIQRLVAQVEWKEIYWKIGRTSVEETYG